MRKTQGFTVVELIIAILFLAIIGTLFLIQKQTIEAINRDSQRKTAINAMYFALKEVYYPNHQHYPRTISPANLKVVDPILFKDPRGVVIGDQKSEYRYEPTGCSGDTCTGYTLRASLERESDYIKQN